MVLIVTEIYIDLQIYRNDYLDTQQTWNWKYNNVNFFGKNKNWQL